MGDKHAHNLRALESALLTLIVKGEIQILELLQFFFMQNLH